MDLWYSAIAPWFGSAGGTRSISHFLFFFFKKEPRRVRGGTKTQRQPFGFHQNPGWDLCSYEYNLAAVCDIFEHVIMCLGHRGALSRFFLAHRRYGHPGFAQLHNARHKTFHPHQLMSVSNSQTVRDTPPLQQELLSGPFCASVLLLSIYCAGVRWISHRLLFGSPAAAFGQTQPLQAARRARVHGYTRARQKATRIHHNKYKKIYCIITLSCVFRVSLSGQFSFGIKFQFVAESVAVLARGCV